ncbi:PIM3 kinase, partial [Polypterus senegalus]
MNNILIQIHTCQIKLMNFEGASQLREGEYTTFRGALKYAPPEWFTKKRYEAAPATVWALGVVLYALVFGVFPFETCKDTVKGNIAFPKNITRDWLSLMYEYELQSLLVTGSFGGFYTARRIIDGLPPGEMRPVPLEIVLMNHIAKAPTSPGVIQLLNWCVSSYNVFLIFDLPEHCVDLDKFVFNNPRYLDESLVRCIFQQIVEAIQHCQERGVYHRDLKMSNVLIQSHSCQIKLINFGCGSHLREGEYTSYRGTLKYAPPEWFVKQRFQAVPATVWSLGVVLYALIFGILPFGTKEETIKGKLRFPCVISPDWIAYLEDYDVESLLGKGAFGEVYAARKKLNGVPPGEQQLIPLEVALMKMAGRSPSSSLVIQLLDWCMDPYDVLLILERPEPCMDLRDFVFESEEYLEEPLVQHIFRQIVEAVKHCHSRGVFHRDVKMNNILIQLHTCQIKLIDFGCGAQLQEGEYNSYRGTLEYAPPECFIEQRYLAVPATVWSLGVVLYALVCGFLPFETREETIKGKVTFPRKVSRGE